MNVHANCKSLQGLSPETVEYVCREAARIRDSLQQSTLIESYLAAAAQSYPLRSIHKAALDSIRDAASSFRLSLPSAPSADDRTERSATPARRRRGRPRVSTDEADLRLINDWRVSGLEKAEYESDRGLKRGDVRRAQDRIRQRPGKRRGETRRKASD